MFTYTYIMRIKYIYSRRGKGTTFTAFLNTRNLIIMCNIHSIRLFDYSRYDCVTRGTTMANNGGPDVARPLSRYRFPIRLPFSRPYYNTIIYTVLYCNIIIAVLGAHRPRFKFVLPLCSRYNLYLLCIIMYIYIIFNTVKSAAYSIIVCI